MNKIIKSAFTALVALCLVLCTFVPAFALERTYRITSAEDLIKLAENCRLDTYSAELTVDLMVDIDLSGVSFDGIPTFSGIFDGNGHTVSGLLIEGEGSVKGFFRYLTESAVVRNLKISGTVTPTGSKNTVGGIAGENRGIIENCSFEGTVTGADVVGGIAGNNKLSGIISGCRIYGEVVGNHFVGGAAGENSGVIRNCKNNALINTTAAQNEVELSDITLGTMTNSESANTVTDVGGIAGSSSGVIRNCENYGDVGYRLMGYNVGGIAGSQNGYLTGCENYGSVSGRKEVGGIVGHAEPITNVVYTEDTLQVLEEQVDTLGVLAGRASSNAQSSAAQITGQIAVLEGYAKDAQDAIDILTPDVGGEMPDADTILAAQNTLTESITAMPGVLDGISQAAGNTMYVLGRDLQAVSDQVGIMGATIGAASEDMGFTVTDISDNDTEEDFLGKVEKCKNYGTVLGDGNVGGIVGALAYENDLDTEDDFAFFGESSMDVSSEIRAVVRDCVNNGKVTVKKQNGGGIVGWQSLGLVRDCLNLGETGGDSADYVGGIAGYSTSFIRDCSVKSIVTGSEYVGGVAGFGKIATDCRTMVKLTADEKFGAIIGFAEELPRVDDEEEKIKGNFYLVVDSDLGAVDGISYDGCAKRLDMGAFFELEGLAPEFKTVSVHFVYEDGTAKTVQLTPGKALTREMIPEIPQKEGYMSSWAGLGEIDATNVRFDAVVYAEYTKTATVIESTEQTTSGRPVLLVQGVFNAKHGLELAKADDVEAPEKSQLLAGYNFNITGGRAEKLRCYIGEGFEKAKIFVMVADESGAEREVSCELEGSYVTFEVTEGDSAFYVFKAAESYALEIAVGAFAIALIVLIISLSAAKKKKSKAAAAE